MVLTNYPLSSFAVCADPNAAARQAAKERHANKMFAYKSDSVKYWNRETDFKNKRQFIQGIGESRQLSDIRQAVEQKRAAGLSAKEQLARKYSATQYVNEGGGSRTAGRNKYLELLNAEDQIDKGIAKLAGRGQGILLEGQRRTRQKKLAEAEKAVGVRPEFGMAVQMPGVDRGAQVMGAVSTALSIASLFAAGSDVRLKEDIEQVGVSPDGHKIYEFNYKGDSTRYRGAMAQDVVKIDPMAVGIRDGYLTVNYGKIDVDMEVIS